MTIFIRIGRRVPKAFFRRQVERAKGIFSLQEHLFIMIRQSMQLAKRKANADGRLKFVMTEETESEDLNYNLQWILITIQGTPAQEQEEYDEANMMYTSLTNVLKKEITFNKEDNKLTGYFKTNLVSPDKIREAYKAGYGCAGKSTLAQKLLELNIITHIEKLDDYATRDK